MMSGCPESFGEGDRGVARAPIFILMKSEGRKGYFEIFRGGGRYTLLGRKWESKPPA